MARRGSMPARVTVLVSADLPWAVALAGSWARQGDAVTLVLLDDAAASVRTTHPAAASLVQAQRAGVSVAAYDEALHRRALDHGRIVDGVKIVDIEELADLTVDAVDKVVWL